MYHLVLFTYPRKINSSLYQNVYVSKQHTQIIPDHTLKESWKLKSKQLVSPPIVGYQDDVYNNVLLSV
jgi:hypothetical protein